jgi:hypothetical protein
MKQNESCPSPSCCHIGTKKDIFVTVCWTRIGDSSSVTGSGAFLTSFVYAQLLHRIICSG